MFAFWDLTPPQRQYRLEKALALSAAGREKHGIGMQSEKTLHSVLKYYFDENPDHHEIPIGSFIADLYEPDTEDILEIQTGNFGPLREKLEVFLPEHRVFLIHPILTQKWVQTADADGVFSPPRKSPKKESFCSVFPEFYRISSFLNHPNLFFLPVCVEVDEYRLASASAFKRDTRLDRIPRSIGPSVLLHEAADYLPLLPSLPDPFCAKDFQKAAHFSPRECSYALQALRFMGILTVSKVVGRTYWYQVLSL